MSNKPITRKEMFMAKASGQNVNTPKPITREEKFLERIAENGGKATSWKDLGEKTVMGDTLTWDGNDDGLIVGSMYENGNYEEIYEEPYRRISEITPTFDEFMSNGYSVTNGCSEVFEFNKDDGMFLVISDDLIMFADAWVFVAYEDNVVVTWDGFVHNFPKKGIYTLSHVPEFPSDNLVSLTINGYNGFPRTEITPIPEEYLPSERLFIRQNSDGLWSADEKIFILSTLEMLDVIVDDGSYYYKVSSVSYASESTLMIETLGVDGLIIDKVNKTIMQD